MTGTQRLPLVSSTQAVPLADLACLPACSSPSVPACSSPCLSTCLSAPLPACLPAWLPACLPACDHSEPHHTPSDRGYDLHFNVPVNWAEVSQQEVQSSLR